MKNKLVVNGKYVMTNEKRSNIIIEVYIDELKKMVKRSEAMQKKYGKKSNGCFLHLNNDISFYVKFKRVKK